ncbi:GNAT family N-acetyltransferase [Jannaschia sp. LMIT008]|uniref:GNAT family N-acetyltransferase n=1 Tax=Jannaschia maritima TaxID=3032585 RepID=UPI0028116EC4|nr:GNAT family N-acetyltransferase [Jannaschia sp. LMIT008]
MGEAIEHVAEASDGRWVLSRDGAEAVTTYSRLSPTKIIVDGTEVPTALRGTGAGKALFDHVVAQARADGFKIVPLCPFFMGQSRKHPDTADVFEM